MSDLIKTDHISGELLALLPDALIRFLDLSQTATDRATYYNNKGEQNEATLALHKELFRLDRGAYILCLLLPGTTDYARQMGLGFLLSNSRRDGNCVLHEDQEALSLTYLSKSIEPQRLLKLFLQLRYNRVNNARTKKLILRSILGSNKLDWWSVKYRTKLRQCLEHAWDKRTSGILRSILKKKMRGDDLSAKENSILNRNINKYIPVTARLQPKEVCQCVSFIFGYEQHPLTIPILRSYHLARYDLSKGKNLPKENLFYLRSRFHKDVDKSEIYDLTKRSMTGRQKMQSNRAAKKVGVDVGFDPRQADVIRLYLYAFEMDMTDEIYHALCQKATRAAGIMPGGYEHIGILVDCSASQRGDYTQKNRPMAISLALRDMLALSARRANVEYTVSYRPSDPPGSNLPSGRSGIGIGSLVNPSGETALGLPLVNLLKHQPQAVFVLSDGYENAPAGEFAETLNKVRELGIDTPVYHMCPVMAAEAGGIRQLSEQVRAIPVSKPEAIGSMMLREELRSDLVQGLKDIARAVLS